MSFDKRFYGIYQGICIDSGDEEGLGRIKLKVPQVLGDAVTDWAPAMGGAPSQMKYSYGTFSSTATQNVSAANTATVITLNTEEDTNSTSVVSGSRVTVEESGDYFLQFSAQFYKSGSSSAQGDVWLRKNGVDVPRSNSRFTLQGNPNEVLLSLSYIIDLDAGDYVEVVFSSADASVGIIAIGPQTSPTRPALPSIIVTLNLVGKFKPQAGAPVWVSFIAGDPNFPVWMGVA
jgi:hypothetical protein